MFIGRLRINNGFQMNVYCFN